MKFKILLLLLLFGWQINAQDCLPDWDYYAEVTIDNSSGNDLSDYQVRLEVNTGMLVTDSKLESSGDDLRFTDEDCNLLHFWMDSLATNEQNVIWVKIPEIAAASSQTIRMYYGNSDAEGYANADSTFIFYDDFESGTVDPAKWDPVGGYATLEVVDGVLHYASDGENPGPRFKFVRTAMSFEGPVLFDFAAEITNSNGFGFSSADVPIERILFRQAGFGFDTLNQVALMLDTVSNGFQVEGFYPLIRYPRFEMQDATIAAGINNDTMLQCNYFSNNSISSASTETYILDNITMSGFHFIVSSFLSAQTVYLDYLRVRGVASNPPATSIGSEMDNTTPTGTAQALMPKELKVYPNPVQDVLYLENAGDQPFQIQLLNNLGQSVISAPLWLSPKGSQSIPVQKLTPGLYLLQLQTNEQIYAQKIMIK
ncbi:MAG: DUF2341 domain-containing protein [Bacteroidetes bacterium]|nr:DUF2341 domain-containing protein [Bacteroidota bacterium]